MLLSRTGCLLRMVLYFSLVMSIAHAQNHVLTLDGDSDSIQLPGKKRRSNDLYHNQRTHYQNEIHTEIL